MGIALSPIFYVGCFTIDIQSFNSIGQNSCTVAAYLLGTCYGGGNMFLKLLRAPPVSSSPAELTLYPLRNTSYAYLGPSEDQAANLCFCNTVTFNLLSACGVCQGGQLRTYISFHCTAICRNYPPHDLAGRIIRKTAQNPWTPPRESTIAAYRLMFGLGPERQISARRFPNPVPPETRVQQWALQDVTVRSPAGVFPKNPTLVSPSLSV